MSPFKAKKLGLLAAGIIGLTLIAAQGCSSGDDSQAAPPSAGAGGGHSAGSTGKSGSANAGSGNGDAGTGATNNNGGSGNTGNNDNAGAGGTPSGGDAGAGGEAGTAPVPTNCDGPAGCYSCTPKTNDQFLNQCVAGGCPAHFDNSTLTKLNLVGTL